MGTGDTLNPHKAYENWKAPETGGALLSPEEAKYIADDENLLSGFLENPTDKAYGVLKSEGERLLRKKEVLNTLAPEEAGMLERISDALIEYDKI